MGSWFEIYVEDIERAKKFYEGVTGKVLVEMPMIEGSGMTMYAFPWTMEGEGAAGALVKSDMNKPSSTGTIIYLDSEDCNASLDLVQQAGGKTVLPRTQAGEWGFFCLFSDSEGNTVGFFSKK